jgi:hypothetical protein
MHGEVAKHRALDLQAAIANRGEVCAAGNEGNVVTGTREFCAVIATDCSRSQNRKSHDVRRL